MKIKMQFVLTFACAILLGSFGAAAIAPPGIISAQDGSAGCTTAPPVVALCPRPFEAEFPVSGSGFQPAEQIVLTIDLPGGPRRFEVTADAQGRFTLVTGLTRAETGADQPEGRIVVTAEGDQGSRHEIAVAWTASSPPGADNPPVQADFPIANGWFYTQTAGGPDRGFAVTDEAGVQFWSEFQRLGGVPGVGYPISQRFVWDGFVSQAFQKMIFQWRPEVGRVYAINVIDLMHEAGLDGWLQVVRATPPMADWSADAGRTWPEIVAAHQALLTDPDIRAAYFAVDDPLTLYGLPMAPIQDMGNVLVLRMQRGILQKWLVETPWAAAGQVTVANSGDVAKEAGLLPAAALQPVAAPSPDATTPTSPLQLTLTAEPRVTTGEPVALTLRVTNPTSEMIRWWTGMPIADFVALRNGVELWRWSHGRAFIAIALRIELAPGETEVYQESWPLVDNSGARVPPGEYQLVGSLTSSPATGDDLARPVPLRSAPVTVTVR